MRMAINQFSPTLVGKRVDDVNGWFVDLSLQSLAIPVYTGYRPNSFWTVPLHVPQHLSCTTNVPVL